MSQPRPLWKQLRQRLADRLKPDRAPDPIRRPRRFEALEPRLVLSGSPSQTPDDSFGSTEVLPTEGSEAVVDSESLSQGQLEVAGSYQYNHNSQMVPDFSLEDVNPTSDTFGQLVSPRDHLSKATAWYFGHST